VIEAVRWEKLAAPGALLRCWSPQFPGKDTPQVLLVPLYVLEALHALHSGWSPLNAFENQSLERIKPHLLHI